jgi:hypothetical protein
MSAVGAARGGNCGKDSTAGCAASGSAKAMKSSATAAIRAKDMKRSLAASLTGFHDIPSA